MADIWSWLKRRKAAPPERETAAAAPGQDDGIIVHYPYLAVPALAAPDAETTVPAQGEGH